jgi:hypothetical protein
MGKISGTTLSAPNNPLDGQIHSFDVVGPEISLQLSRSTNNPKENVQMWVYLTS